MPGKLASSQRAISWASRRPPSKRSRTSCCTSNFALPSCPPHADRGAATAACTSPISTKCKSSTRSASRGPTTSAAASTTPPSRWSTCAFRPSSWQTYDIDFRAARFTPDGKTKKENAVVTVRHNGVPIQYNLELKGATPGGHRRRRTPRPHLPARPRQPGPVPQHLDCAAVGVAQEGKVEFTCDRWFASGWLRRL